MELRSTDGDDDGLMVPWSIDGDDDGLLVPWSIGIIMKRIRMIESEYSLNITLILMLMNDNGCLTLRFDIDGPIGE